MLIPLWLFTLMLSLITVLFLSTYYLFGLLFLIIFRECGDGIDNLRDECQEVISKQSLYFWEKAIINKAIRIINLIEDEQKIFAQLSFWPITLIIFRWSGLIAIKRLKDITNVQIAKNH